MDYQWISMDDPEGGEGAGLTFLHLSVIHRKLEGNSGKAVESIEDTF